jgi:sulfite reductase (NADPH) hemoprotein beta-component
MVGGGISNEGAAFARLAAKIPARRVPEAVDRLIALYARDHVDQEPAQAFFARIGLDTIKAELADLERLAADEAAADDFVDLGETAEFAPVVMEGECAT